MKIMIVLRKFWWKNPMFKLKKKKMKSMNLKDYQFHISKKVISKKEMNGKWKTKICKGIIFKYEKKEEKWQQFIMNYFIVKISSDKIFNFIPYFLIFL